MDKVGFPSYCPFIGANLLRLWQHMLMVITHNNDVASTDNLKSFPNILADPIEY